MQGLADKFSEFVHIPAAKHNVADLVVEFVDFFEQAGLLTDDEGEDLFHQIAIRNVRRDFDNRKRQAVGCLNHAIR